MWEQFHSPRAFSQFTRLFFPASVSRSAEAALSASFAGRLRFSPSRHATGRLSGESVPHLKEVPMRRRKGMSRLQKSIRAVCVELLEQRQLMSASYSITDLGTLGGSSSHGFGINKNGVIVGDSEG